MSIALGELLFQFLLEAFVGCIAADSKRKRMAGNPVVLCVGEVLWDLLPEGKVFGGATANVAWHAAQLGAQSYLASAVGEDGLGREIISRLEAMGLPRRLVRTLPDKPTGAVEVSLSAAGEASYHIREGAAWDFIPRDPELLEMAAGADAINFGSLAQRSPESRLTIDAVLSAARRDALKVFDLNLRPPFVDGEIIAGGLARADVVKMNEGELAELAGRFGWSREPEKAMLDLFAAHPLVRHIVVTRAGEGAWWRTRDRLISRSPEREARVRDSVGAGDSVTACVILGLLAGKREEDILEQALRVAAFVCEQPGGTPELPDELKKWRAP